MLLSRSTVEGAATILRVARTTNGAASRRSYVGCRRKIAQVWSHYRLMVCIVDASAARRIIPVPQTAKATGTTTPRATLLPTTASTPTPIPRATTPQAHQRSDAGRRGFSDEGHGQGTPATPNQLVCRTQLGCSGKDASSAHTCLTGGTQSTAYGSTTSTHMDTRGVNMTWRFVLSCRPHTHTHLSLSHTPISHATLSHTHPYLSHATLRSCLTAHV